MLKYFMWVALLFSGIVGYGQKLSGVVRDSASKEVLPFATLSVRAQDSVVITGTLTDEKGAFTLSLPKDAFTIEVDYIGYDKQIIPRPFSTEKLADLLLMPSETRLDEVVVQGERASQEFLIDRKVVNFDKDLQTTGGTAFEAFQQLPGVRTNLATGEVSLRGNTNVMILVNGKPSPLSNQDLLEQLNVSQLEKVEVISSPSAKYRADGLAGIINIVLKDEVIKGVAGSVTVDTRTNPGYGGSFSLTRGFKSFNLQGAVSRRENFFSSEVFRNRQLLEVNEVQQVSTLYKFDGFVNTASFKADWFLNSTNDFSAAINYTNNEHDVTNTTRVQNEMGTLINRQYNFHEHNTAEYSLNYRKRFGTEGSSFLDIDFNYNENNNMLPAINLIDEELSFDNDIEFNNDIVNTALDYVTALGDFKLETGGLYTAKNIESRQYAITPDAIMQTRYEYDESTYAGYALLERPYSKLKIQAGVRSEWFHSESQGTDGIDQRSITKDFFSLFPSVHVQYDRSDRVSYTAAVSRRISRPNFLNINPITTINDPLFRRMGNPGLNPEFTNNFELGMNINSGSIAVHTSMYYRYTTDFINPRFYLNDDGITIMTFENDGDSQTVGAELSVSNDLSEKITTTFSANGYYIYTDFQTDNFYLGDQYSYDVKANLKYTPSNRLSFDLQYMYFGNSRLMNERLHYRNFTDIAASYKVLKNRGKINLRITDAFKGDVMKSERFGNDVQESRKWIGLTRRIAILSFQYSFSKGSEVKRRKIKQYKEPGALE